MNELNYTMTKIALQKLSEASLANPVLLAGARIFLGQSIQDFYALTDVDDVVTDAQEGSPILLEPVGGIYSTTGNIMSLEVVDNSGNDYEAKTVVFYFMDGATYRPFAICSSPEVVFTKLEKSALTITAQLQLTQVIPETIAFSYLISHPIATDYNTGSVRLAILEQVAQGIQEIAGAPLVAKNGDGFSLVDSDGDVILKAIEYGGNYNAGLIADQNLKIEANELMVASAQNASIVLSDDNGIILSHDSGEEVYVQDCNFHTQYDTTIDGNLTVGGLKMVGALQFRLLKTGLSTDTSLIVNGVAASGNIIGLVCSGVARRGTWKLIDSGGFYGVQQNFSSNTYEQIQVLFSSCIVPGNSQESIEENQKMKFIQVYDGAGNTVTLTIQKGDSTSIYTTILATFYALG